MFLEKFFYIGVHHERLHKKNFLGFEKKYQHKMALI